MPNGQLSNLIEGNEATSRMETPCIDVCVLDDATSQCAGCGRTIGEITRWASLSPAERRAVMDALPSRPGPHQTQQPKRRAG